jgi:hypothetical protein
MSLCPVCQDYCQDAVQLVCSHSYCRQCLLLYLASQKDLQCFECFAPLDQNDLGALSPENTSATKTTLAPEKIPPPIAKHWTNDTSTKVPISDHNSENDDSRYKKINLAQSKKVKLNRRKMKRDSYPDELTRKEMKGKNELSRKETKRWRDSLEGENNSDNQFADDDINYRIKRSPDNGKNWDNPSRDDYWNTEKKDDGRTRADNVHMHPDRKSSIDDRKSRADRFDDDYRNPERKDDETSRANPFDDDHMHPNTRKSAIDDGKKRSNPFEDNDSLEEGESIDQRPKSESIRFLDPKPKKKIKPLYRGSTIGIEKRWNVRVFLI